MQYVYYIMQTKTQQHVDCPSKRGVRIRSVRAASAVLCLLLMSWSARAENFALLVGVGEFPQIDQGSINLPGIDIDLRNMADMMERLGVPARNIQQLYNRTATRAAVVNALQQMASRLKPTDRLYVYVSTHGGQITNIGGDYEEDDLDEFLAFSDLQHVPQKSSSEAAHQVRGILLDDDFGHLLANIKATTIVIIDACASGTVTKGLGDLLSGKISRAGKFISAGWMRQGKAFVGRAAQPKEHFDTPNRDNLIVMAASQDNEESLATPTGSHYTNALIASVEASNAVLTPYCLHRTVQLELAKNPRNAARTPEFEGGFGLANRLLTEPAGCLLYTSPSPRDGLLSRMPSSA